MRIRKIRIKNFRNLRDVEVRPAPITVFIGENNVGKSNFLHALRLIFDPETRRLEAELSEEDINDIARSAKENYFIIAVEIGNLQHHQDLEAVFRDRIDAEDEETYVTIEGKYELDKEGFYTWTVQVMPPEGRHNEPQRFLPHMARRLPLYFLGPVRDAEREMRATRRGTLSQLLRDVSLDDVEKEVIQNIRNANEALCGNQDIASLAEGITTLLSPLIPGGEGEVSISVATEDATQLVKGLTLSLERQSDYRAYDMFRHGTGLQNLVLIAMFRHRISSQQKIYPILAIEEPESHLHPQVQRCLVRDLSSIESPILFTTHSPTIAEYCDPLGLVRLASDERGGVTAHQLLQSRISIQDLRYLARFMRDSADAFFARAIIVVEGQSEKIVLPAFAEQMGRNLDREGISVVTAHGGSFSFILRSCDQESFAIPTVVIFDTDVLSRKNDLVNEAYKLSLIEKTLRDQGREGNKDVRKKILEDIGWIPAEPNLEGELARSGYAHLILEVIKDFGQTRSFNDFLEEEGLNEDAEGITRFFAKRRRSKLKIPVAFAVAKEVTSIGSFPACYAKAIELAKQLAESGGTKA